MTKQVMLVQSASGLASLMLSCMTEALTRCEGPTDASLMLWVQGDAAWSALHSTADSCRLAEATRTPGPTAHLPQGFWQACQLQPGLPPVTTSHCMRHEITRGRSFCSAHNMVAMQV